MDGERTPIYTALSLFVAVNPELQNDFDVGTVSEVPAAG
jgi:hypothetical protein